MRISWTLGLTLSLAVALHAGLPASASPARPDQEERSTEPRPGVHFVPSLNSVVDAMLEMAAVTAEDVVYDLGSGDGRIVIKAAQEYGARGVGIELDAELVEESRKKAEEAGVSDRVTFIQADLFRADLSEATVVTMYLLPSMNARLQGKFLEELRPGTRIVSHRFPMGDWEPDQKRSVSGRDIFFWTVPEREVDP